MNRKKLSRRTMLRGAIGGAAVAVGLPTLEIMLDSHGEALADGSPLPKRFVSWFFGNGVVLNRFTPSGSGANYTLSEELLPLAGVQPYLSVISGMNNRCEMLITHHEGMTIFNGYTMVEVSGLYSKAGGPTIDQVIASRIGAGTHIPSGVHVGISKRLSVMDGGTTMHYLSHKSTNEPVPPIFNPQTVWTQVFGSFVPPEDPSGPLRVSVLDAVRDQTNTLKKRLGKLDTERLDAHLEGVAALETKIQTLPPVCTTPGMPPETNQDSGGVEPMEATNRAMSDLLAYAFACDITRTASVLFVGGAAEATLHEAGQTEVHHNNTHNNNAQQEVHEGVVYIMQNFAYFLEKLRDTPDSVATGSLLDNSIVFCSSDCSEGYSHSVQQQPILLAGRGGGALVHPGIHLNAPGRNPTDVLLTCAQAFDPAITSIGGGDPMSTTPCAEIKGV